jgi:general secretion pathway protein G
MRARVRKAFTLVEILIVVVILGILAAIVVPQFTTATQDAQAGNLSAQLDTLNNQLELYKAKNQGNAPADLIAGGTPAMATQVWGPWATLINNGYLKLPPRNPACPKTGPAGPTFGDNQCGIVATGASASPPSGAVGWNFWDQNGDGTLDTIAAAYFDEPSQTVTPATP